MGAGLFAPPLFKGKNMARAKTGGTSAKLRGVVGDYIYQIIRDPYGNTEQKVITYTKEKLNRNTKYQCLARMQITMFMRCMNVLTPIICDSFQGLRSRVNSCNRFVELNIKTLQDYCVNHWKESLACAWPRKGDPTLTFFPFIISEGNYPVPKIFSWIQARPRDKYPTYRFNLAGTACRRYDVRKALGFSSGDSINLLYWLEEGRYVALLNLEFNPLFNDYTVITSQNVANLFRGKLSMLNGSPTMNYTFTLGLSWDTTTKMLSFRPVIQFRNEYGRFDLTNFMFSYIFSKRKGNTWLRNTNRFMLTDPDELEVDFGEPPNEAYHYWDENYDDEDYDEYFL